MSYKMYVRPHLDYGDVIYHNSRSYLMALIEQVQYKVLNYTMSYVGKVFLTADGSEDLRVFIRFVINKHQNICANVFLLFVKFGIISRNIIP